MTADAPISGGRHLAPTEETYTLLADLMDILESAIIFFTIGLVSALIGVYLGR